MKAIPFLRKHGINVIAGIVVTIYLIHHRDRCWEGIKDGISDMISAFNVF